MKENKNWKKQIALFLISQNLSMFGSSVVGFSIVWYITVTTESGFWITLSTLATLIPQVLVSLWAGVFADRYNKKTIIMLADGFTALATLLAFVAFHYGFANLSFLIFIACLRSVGGGFQAPAVNALYPEIVPREHLLRINGINQMANNVLLLLSPAAGGALLGGAFVAWKGEFKNKITMIAVSLAVFGCTFALMGLSRVFWVYLIFDCICGMFVPVLIASETVLIQTNTEKGYMGRVFALLQFVSQGMMPIAILGFGPLSDLVRIESIMIGCGLLLICWSLYFKKAAGRALCSI